MSAIITEIAKKPNVSEKEILKIFFKHPVKGVGVSSKAGLLLYYKELKNKGRINLSAKEERSFLQAVKMKKVRTNSGVSPVTVMTKPYPCPGRCIYCPNDPKVPKSYLSNEPGAQRALSNNFDPYLQTYNRLLAYQNIGHPTDKVEMIIIGGTWSYYPLEYRKWFVSRCFEALNAFFNAKKKVALNTKEKEFLPITWEKLKKVQKTNENAKSRCVGLSIETRPDNISADELIVMRKMGVTKIQLGLQSLNDKVLKSVRRGHTSAKSAKSISLLRQFGFKIQVHWMPNLLGSNLAKDLKEYQKIFFDKRYKPDEIKIYPCSLISGTELEKHYQQGFWKPYSTEDLTKLVGFCLLNTPRYCRIDRIIRDISSSDILAGNKVSNLRQLVEKSLENQKIKEIRSREIKDIQVEKKNLQLKETTYTTAVSREIFMEMVDNNDRLAGFLRLSLPKEAGPIKELDKSAIIREIHVYGVSLDIGSMEKGRAQHIGIGKQLIRQAIAISKKAKYAHLTVISSVGTRNYYRNIGFHDGTLYQFFDLRT